MEGFLWQHLKIIFPPCASSMGSADSSVFLAIGSLSGWSSENLMLLFVTAGAYFSISTLFLLCSGSRLLPTPLTSLLDSVSVGSSSQRTRESPCSAGKHCQHCSSRQSSQRVTQPALCCGFVLNYSNSPLSQGSGQQTSSALSHLGYFHQPFPESWIHGQEMLCASSPCCVLWDRGWLPAQTSGPAMLPGQGLCCWWLQWDGAKKFMESLGNWLFCFVLDFSFWWRFLFSL